MVGECFDIVCVIIMVGGVYWWVLVSRWFDRGMVGFMVWECVGFC